MSDIKDTLKVIQELMSELQDKMEPTSEDFGERLGRPKPSIDVLKIEGSSDEGSDQGEGPAHEADPMDPQEDMAEGEMGDHMGMGPEEDLKSRLMKLRGK